IVHLEMPIATEEQMEHAAIREKETKRRKSSLKGLRILAVEDNDVNREIILRLLRARDAVVETAGNGLEAVQQYLKRPAYYYDAILMDVQMPCMNGIEATREIRHTDRPDAETIPIIAMTANAFQDDKEATKEAGMNAHLSKPINIGQIVTVVCREVSKNKKE
ncbi:MAG: response regulator, partial [Lachnospiraceae bacterium]|nr:response regulator [Lachnospiraceae bacterium]